MSDADAPPPGRAARAAYRGGRRLATQVYRIGDGLIDQAQRFGEQPVGGLDVLASFWEDESDETPQPVKAEA